MPNCFLALGLHRGPWGLASGSQYYFVSCFYSYSSTSSFTAAVLWLLYIYPNICISFSHLRADLCRVARHLYATSCCCCIVRGREGSFGQFLYCSQQCRSSPSRPLQFPSFLVYSFQVPFLFYCVLVFISIYPRLCNKTTFQHPTFNIPSQRGVYLCHPPKGGMLVISGTTTGILQPIMVERGDRGDFYGLLTIPRNCAERQLLFFLLLLLHLIPHHETKRFDW